MIISKTDLEGLVLIELDRYVDDRGHFLEIYNSIDHDRALTNEYDFVQDNFSVSKKGVFRGFHFQEAPYSQAKLVQVLNGSAVDIVIDLRSASKTYGRSFKVELSGDDNLQLFIPGGFAHGFLSLQDNTQFHYKCDNYYSKDHERTLLWNSLGIDLNLPLKDLIISDKDLSGESFSDFVSPF